MNTKIWFRVCCAAQWCWNRGHWKSNKFQQLTDTYWRGRSRGWSWRSEPLMASYTAQRLEKNKKEKIPASRCGWKQSSFNGWFLEYQSEENSIRISQNHPQAAQLWRNYGSSGFHFGCDCGWGWMICEGDPCNPSSSFSPSGPATLERWPPFE